MTINEYKKQLKALVDADNAQVIVLKGEWGCGKTYFWNDFVENDFDEKEQERFVYVSLFGHRNFESLQNNILFQAFSRNEYIDKISGVLKNIKTSISGDAGEFGGFTIGTGILGNTLSLFKKNSLSGLTICIDDFERKSDELSYSEIMGFVSNLKERFGSTVILIMDEENLRDEGGWYSQYSEKVVDCEFKYNPSQEDIIDKLLNKVENKYKIGIQEAFGLYHRNNLRTVKKAVRNVSFVSQMIGPCNDWRSSYIAYNISLLTIVYCGLGYEGLSKLSYFELQNMNAEEEFSQSMVKEYAYAYGTRVSEHFAWHNFLWEFIHTSLLDLVKFESLLSERELEKEKEIKYRQVFDILDQYTFDLSKSAEEFIEELTSAINGVGYNIFEYTSFENINYLFSVFKEFSDDADTLFRQFKMDYIRDRVCEIDGVESARKFKYCETISSICASDIKVKEYYEAEFGNKINDLYTLSLFKERLKEVQSARSWGDFDDKYFDGVRVELLRKWFQEDPEFVKISIQFARSHSQSDAFVELREKITRAFVELKDELGEWRFNRITKLSNNSV
ncbi:KAP P-loop domain-containing protein [Maridesulfovibrio salexigens]|uniref:KAP P-loop domain protein n=1 Tax=Maridesulfovibrio salexigens (strain ATCC 14822 / DSM 2638 / NCIMB 8403 / VKM B-1763) TaxID=526222 RepID=C6BZG3_MARSD|nr:KAP P-loop domain-containing protein [Maridesulfovibrio salexigens]ACS80800.1 KAP P-loop domain protein [Maridesulfovibrio salexigens DSM 2638]